MRCATIFSLAAVESAFGICMKALVTGSGGLIGSECSRFLAALGWRVIGIDNDLRSHFFGPDGTTRPVVDDLIQTWPEYRHFDLDIRDREGVRELMRQERPEFIIHTAAQPSHDKAASIPYEDFDVNAVGTLNLLVAARDYCRESPFCFTSTNKVYGDRPNCLPLVELETRYDYAGGIHGIDESLSIDHCLHSLFGASKVAADVLCQEFGRYFGMPVGIFRGGCLTGRAPTPRSNCTAIWPTSCTARSRGNRTRFMGIRGSRYAIRFMPGMWRGCSCASWKLRDAARSTTSEADERIASPSSKRSMPSSKVVTHWLIRIAIRVERETTSAISRT